MRRQRCYEIAAASLLISAALAQPATVHDAGKLTPGHPVERELLAGGTDVFTVDAAAGQYIHIVADRRGVDLVVSVLAPDGAVALKADTPRPDLGPESVSLITTAAGAWRIQVSAPDQSHGKYSLELTEVRPPVAADRKRIQAEGDRNNGTARERAGEKAGFAEAVTLFGQAASEWRDLHDDDEQAISLIGQAGAYLSLSQGHEGLAAATQALGLFRNAKNQTGEAAALLNQGMANAALGDNAKAMENFNAALSIQAGMGDHKGESEILIQRGLAYFALGDPKSALTDLDRSLDLRRTQGDDAGVAEVLTSMGSVYSGQGQYQKAIDNFNQALKVFEAAGKQAAQSDVLDGLGTAYSTLGDKSKAEQFYQRALTLRHLTGNQDDEATTLNNLGIVAADTGQGDQAITYFNRALALSRVVDDRYLEANVLANLAAEYGNVGQRKKSIEILDQAIPLLDAQGDQVGKGMALTNKGLNYTKLGEHEKALEAFEQALPLQRKTEDRMGEALSTIGTGNVYNNLGDLDKASDYYIKALALYRALKNPRGEEQALNNTGLVYLKQKQFEKALDCFNQALPIARSTQDRAAEAATLESMANAAREIGLQQKTKALEYAQQSLDTARAAGDRNAEGRALLTIAFTNYDLGGQRAALASFEEALPILREVGDRSGEATGLHGMAKIFQDRLMDDAAVCLLKEAVILNQGIREDNRGLADDLQRTYAKTVEAFYRDLAGLLVDQERFGEAEEVLDLLKEREALSYTERDALADQLKPLSLTPEEKQALARYDRLQEQIVPIGQKFAALVSKTLSPAEYEQRTQLANSLADANLLLARYFNEIQNSLPAKLTGRLGEIREAAGLQPALRQLGPDVAAIYTLVLPDKYVAVLITGGARKAYITKIGEAELNRKIFAFREQLQIPSANPIPLAQELYHIVFPEGLRRDLDNAHVKTIMWSIDSTLRYIPIAALHDGDAYLVTRFRNSLITPASIDRLRDAPSPLWKGVGFGVSKSKSADFGDLPSVPGELNRIFRAESSGAAPIQGRVLLDAQFTQDAFQQALSDPAKQVVHIATHFQSRPGVASNSRMLFGDGTVLTLADIQKIPALFDGVDLLTLSACNTAFTNNRIHEEDGREVDSFGTIAQQSGAKSVIASLWGAHDVATARLMETMYRLRQENPAAGKSEALRLAQQEMAEGRLRPDGANAQDDWTHPYYWAAFILIGNWR